jgi:UDP-glucose 4-epimerase
VKDAVLKRVLVTGGLGFIGSNLALRLAEMGSEVTLIDSLIPEYGGNLFNIKGYENRVSVNIADIRDPHSMRYLVQGKDVLFNLAGQTSHMDSMKDPETDLQINCTSQLSILEACRKYNPSIKVVYASTRQIYGRPDYLPVDERHPLRPVDVNGINKMAGEWYHILYNNVYGLRASALRLTNTYGPRMRVKDARQTFLGVWIRLAVEERPFEVWGGDQLRDFTYVEDAVDAFLLAATNPAADGKIFNLGGYAPVSLTQLGAMVADLSKGTSFQIREFPKERKAIDIGDYYADFSSISECLGWPPKVSLKDGLSQTMNYYREFLPEYL